MSISYNGERVVLRCDGDVLDWLKISVTDGSEYFDKWVESSSRLAKRGLIPFGSHIAFNGEALEISWREHGWWGSEDLIEELSLSGESSHYEPLVLLGRVFQGDYNDFYPGLRWYPVEHQSGGLSCKQFKFIGTPIKLSDSGARKINALSKFCEFEDGHCCVGIGGVRLNEVVRYAELIKSLGLKCESSWGELVEGVSPIDMREDNLEALGEVVGLDIDLYELSRYNKEGLGFTESSGWMIVVLYENCD